MNTIIWIIQGVLAAIFLLAAIKKIITQKQKLIDEKQIDPDGSALPIRLLGFVEILGVIGIILPKLIGILPILTSLAAIGFSIVMVGAFVIHYKKKNYKILPFWVLIFILSLIVAYFRF
jgi:hypothetical protein